MKKAILGLSILVSALLAIPQSSSASPIMSGVANFAGDSLWTATVTYEVYAPGDATYIPADSDYHYFYYITNTTGVGGASLKTFTVGNPLKMPTILSGSVDRGLGTPAPTTVAVFADSTAYYFISDVVDPTESSDWLYYTSPYAPSWVTGGLVDGGKTDWQPVPGPVPEPASMLLLGIGLIGLAGGKIRKRFTA